MLQLSSGVILTFRLSKVPIAHTALLLQDISRIAKTWDNTQPEWEPSQCILHIQGHVITMKYWDEVYKYSGKPNWWEPIKRKWHNWKVSQSVLFDEIMLGSQCLVWLVI
jgi:hypothetical protein